MKIKTAELDGPPLAWAVGMAEGDKVYRMRVARPIDWKGEDDNRWVVRAQVPNVGWFADYIYQPYTDWSQGGPIIEREGLTIGKVVSSHNEWSAESFQDDGIRVRYLCYGPTPLIAAMRCFVASKLGEEVEVPDELA